MNQKPQTKTPIQHHKKWIPSKTFAFMKMYRSNSLLWDVKHCYYKDRNQRLKVYKMFCQRFGLTIDEVKAKIKNLRATYFQEVKKAIQYKNEGRTYNSNLIWLDEMKYCVENSDVTPHTNEHLDNIALKIEMDVEDMQSIKSEQFSITSEDISREPLDFDVKDENPLGSAQISEIVPEPYTLHDDEFDIFGRYVATQLRQLNVYRALNMEAKIVELLTQERAKDLKDKGKMENDLTQFDDEFSPNTITQQQSITTSDSTQSTEKFFDIN